jgi:hypothetical protein
MHVEFLIGDDGVCLVMSPEGALEEELLKTLIKQDNTMQQARAGITVFNKTLGNALIIAKKSVLEPERKHEGNKENV